MKHARTTSSARSRPLLLCSGIAAMALALHATGASALATLELKSNSVVDANALLFASNGEWGRGVNAQAFQAEPMVTFNGHQYATWYRYSSGNPAVMIARRSVNGAATGAWEVVNTGSTLANGLGDSNVHNVISLGISPADGTLHLSWDQHVHNLKYRVSSPGVATTSKNLWGSGMFTAQRSYLVDSSSPVTQVTYPTFFATPDGDLQFAYRTGTSGNGTFVLANYAGGTGGAAGTWSASRALISGTGSYNDLGIPSSSRNGYFNKLDYGPDGKLHVTWVWREGGDTANHDINYAYSEDGGTTWKNNAGQQVANLAASDALRISDPGLVVKQLDSRQSLYNQTTQAVDDDGRVHTLVVHRRQEAGFEWNASSPVWDPLDSAYYHYYRDPTTGAWSERQLPTDTGVGSRPSMAVDKDGNVYAVYTNRGVEDGDYKYNPGALVISGATAASNYTDWQILYQGSTQLIGEPFLDKTRLLNDGILSIFMQENSANTARTGTSLRVMEFAVPEPAAGVLLIASTAALVARRRKLGRR